MLHFIFHASAYMLYCRSNVYKVVQSGMILVDGAFSFVQNYYME